MKIKFKEEELGCIANALCTTTNLLYEDFRELKEKRRTGSFCSSDDMHYFLVLSRDIHETEKMKIKILSLLPQADDIKEALEISKENISKMSFDPLTGTLRMVVGDDEPAEVS